VFLVPSEKEGRRARTRFYESFVSELPWSAGKG